MAKRKNGSTAVLDDPQEAFKNEVTEPFRDMGILAEGSPPAEQVDTIPATLETDPIQGPIVEPSAIAVYEHEHYEQIRDVNQNVRKLQDEMEAAKRAAKMAKDHYDDAAAALGDLISRGPSIPGRRYAKKIRLLKEVQADAELGKGFLTLTKGQEFDVHDIEGLTVAILIDGIVNWLNSGEYEVIDWSEVAPKPEELPKMAKRIKLLIDFKSADSDVQFDAGTEHVCEVDGDNVSIKLLGKEVFLKAGEFEVIEWVAPVDADGWKSVAINELKAYGVKPSVLDALVFVGITTLGKLLDFQQDGTELTSIDGIGPEKDAQIADAMIAFWSENSHWNAG